MSSVTLNQLIETPELMLDMANEDVFDLDWPDVERMQLAVIKRRFEELRPKVKILENLSNDIGASSIGTLADVTTLCFPHTIYKSYSMSYIENGRYDKLNRWFQGLTAVDVSGIDASGCDSIESWLALLEAKTELRPQGSSGTSGKCSVFPRTLDVEKKRVQAFMQCHDSYRDEQGSNLQSGDMDMFSPWPVRTGRHNFPDFFTSLEKYLYNNKGNPGNHVHTLGNGHWDLDLMWLSGRIKTAESRGETLKMTPVMQRLRERLIADQQMQKASNAENIDKFIHELMVEHADRPVFLLALNHVLIPLAQECTKRGYSGLCPGSYLQSGGGTKGMQFPDDWEQQIQKAFPLTAHTVYGMTEILVNARKCSKGHHHMPALTAIFLIDPDTSEPLPRSGTQTGRMVVFDLLPTTFWAGTITGDRITINWDGGCSCGRKGAFFYSDIERYSNLRDDDKITCAKSPDAYEKAVDLTLGSTFS